MGVEVEKGNKVVFCVLQLIWLVGVDVLRMNEVVRSR